MAVSGEGKSVLSEPSGAARASLGGGISVALAQSARRLASGGLATKLAMLLLRFADPLDARISADGCVARPPLARRRADWARATDIPPPREALAAPLGSERTLF